ncbi:MAG TPA: hypothetical protein VIM58_00610 [Candidatus Methylacidiphilales bacterium]
MAAFARLLAGLALALCGLFVLSRLAYRAPMLKSRPFVLLVILPLVLLFVWGYRKATRDRED